MKKLNQSKAITLIALIVTIIILLILAGVTIATLTGENGILTKAMNAKKIAEVSSESEKIKLILLSNSMNIENTSDLGATLYDRTIENGDKWHIISVTEPYKIYGTGWRYIAKGTEIEGYGKTENNWCINMDTGETIQLEEDNYVELAYGANLAVSDGLILNVDPVNMSDGNSLGNGVTLYGVEEDDGYGWNSSELKFDGVDDYLEIYTDMNMDEGITFEFYGKSVADSIVMLSKTIKDSGGYAGRFRTQFNNKTNTFWCCMSGARCNSSWISPSEPHWIIKENIGTFNNENGGYLTMTVNLESDTISLYWNGDFIGETTCSHDWLIGGDLTNNSVPFVVGLIVVGDTYTERYSEMDLYACRLYNQVLTSDEVKSNYDSTVAYHNLLVESDE